MLFQCKGRKTCTSLKCGSRLGATGVFRPGGGGGGVKKEVLGVVLKRVTTPFSDREDHLEESHF